MNLQKFIAAEAERHVWSVAAGRPDNVSEWRKAITAEDYKAGAQLLLPVVERMKTALEFYANGFSPKLTESMMGVNTPAYGDRGLRAQQCLAELEKLGEM